MKHDAVYSIPTETHNPIGLHASVAVYDGDRFTLYETSQAVVNHRDVRAAMLGVPPDKVQVITRYLGSGFGGKLWPWPHSGLAAACARNLHCPVKLVVSRAMMFECVGHPPAIDQRIQIAADASDKFTAIQQDYANHTSIQDDYDEGCGEEPACFIPAPTCWSRPASCGAMWVRPPQCADRVQFRACTPWSPRSTNWPSS